MAAGRNILIFHLGAMGDFIVTWPLALALARVHPQSRVFYVTHGQKGALAERILGVESVDIEAGQWHHLFGDAGLLPAASARLLAGAHTVVSFIAGPADRWTQSVAAANPSANILHIDPTAPDVFAGHQVQWLVDQLRDRPAVESAARQVLNSVNERGIGNRPVATDTIIIHPGGGAPAKCWPADRYVALIERLRAAGRDVRVLLGEVELERWPAQTLTRLRSAGHVAMPTTLLELHAETSRAALFIGNDSGPAHLAGIVGVPTLALFGDASKPHRWKPLGPRVRIIQAPLESINVDRVMEEIAHTSSPMQAAAPIEDD